MELYLIKLGGSVITDVNKPNTSDVKTLTRMLNEIKHAASDSSKEFMVIVGHGSGSFGHAAGHKYRTHEGLIGPDSVHGASITSAAAANLHRIVINAMIEEGLHPFSFPPSAGTITSAGKIVNWNIAHMKHALNNGFIPVTCGDVTLDTKKGVTIVPTEAALEYIASKIKPKKVIIATDLDGVFTSNPKIDKSARLIPSITKKNIEQALGGASGSMKVDVTGGMLDKLQRLYKMSKKFGIECDIVNAKVPGRLYAALTGGKFVGTKIRA